MELEPSRKRASDGILCDPALKRLQKAARRIAMAQKLVASKKKPSPTQTPDYRNPHASKQHRDTSAIINSEPWTTSPISPAASSASYSSVSKDPLEAVETLVTPPKRHQELSRRPSLATTKPMRSPVDASRANATSNMNFQQNADPMGFAKAPDVPLASIKRSTAISRNAIQSQEHQPTGKRIDRTQTASTRVLLTGGCGSYFSILLRLLQLLLPLIALLAMPRTIPFSIRESVVSTTHADTALTLRNVIEDHEKGFHLAMAPAFFGFYGYFGALAAWYDFEPTPPIRSLAGASAGAMAAVLIGAGVAPQTAADFCSNITVSRFADFPGFGAVFRGHKFERIMDEFLRTATNRTKLESLKLEEAILPVAVTAFDLQTLQGKILTTGSMAKAARASATFPFLFQPVGWEDSISSNDYVFIDGGIADPNGLVGLTKTLGTSTSRRIVNLSIGSLLPVRAPFDESSTEIISVSIVGLPRPSPFAMHKGSIAYEKARKAMSAALDTPLKRRSGGYELTIHADSS